MELQHNTTIPLWNNAPFNTDSNGLPTITPFFPPEWLANGKSIVIFPGGAYHHFGSLEGDVYAEYFNKAGYTCFVVKYRLCEGHHYPAQLADALKAVRFVRACAAEYNLKSDCIGVMGSSAGGHMAVMASTLFNEPIFEDGEDRTISSRPDFSVLCYPVVTMLDPYVNACSRSNLLGDNADNEELRKHLSGELAINAETPPAFIWHTFEDVAVPLENSMLYASALRRFNIPFELHIYEKGGHGKGLYQGHPWSAELIRWLNCL